MKIHKILIFSIALCLFASCMQHDGYIGKWFGSWYLEEMLVNGEIDEEYEDFKTRDDRQVMVNFQSQLFNMAYINSSEIYGTWDYTDEILTLNSSYNAGSGYQSDYFNPYPTIMHFPAGVEILQIPVTKQNGRTMQWQYSDAEGNIRIYNFRKYP